MMYAEIHGDHEPNNGSGITAQEMLDLLRSIPRKARDNYLRVIGEDGCPVEVSGLHFGKSDQAEKWEFKVYIRTVKESK